jgi:hypothetical protein
MWNTLDGLFNISHNLKYMRAFAEAYPDKQIVLRSAAQIPWRHNQTLLDRLKDPDQQLWYAPKKRLKTVGVGISWQRRLKLICISDFPRLDYEPRSR